MKAIIGLMCVLFATSAYSQEPQKGPPPAPSGVHCTVSGTFQTVDMRDAACYPVLNKATCSHWAAASGDSVGQFDIDIDDAKVLGQKVMAFAQKRTCEGKPNCGPYAMEFSSVAKCDGRPVSDMPGGLYLGLTSQAARDIQHFGNTQQEQLSLRGKARGDKARGKGKGLLWGNP